MTYPLSQHTAEKLHAYVRPRSSGEGSRVKDLLDIVLISTHIPIKAQALRAAILATFAAQTDSERPDTLPPPPPNWASRYQRLAREVGLTSGDLADAFAQAAAFLDPVLSDRAEGEWSPDGQSWLLKTAPDANHSR
jgi:hypothetical protein